MARTRRRASSNSWAIRINGCPRSTIEAVSPIHLGSGAADVNLDADIIHDEFGLPYFPAKRFKGLLYESAVELEEMFELAGMPLDETLVEDIFHHRSTFN